MKLAVIGSREIIDFDTVESIIEDFIDDRLNNKVSCIISGGANGVDTIAKNFATKYKYDYIEFLPYFKIGPRGYDVNDYFVRNEQILDNADAVLIIWDGKSSSINNADLAERKGKILKVVKI